MQWFPVLPVITQGQGAVPVTIDIIDLDIRFTLAEIVLVGQGLANCLIAVIIVNSSDLEFQFFIIIQHREQFHVSYYLR